MCFQKHVAKDAEMTTLNVLSAFSPFLCTYFFVPGIETKFAGSSCNDLVTADGSGSTIISGHFDKRIRFWDTRSESGPNEIVVNGKVTSLDMTRGLYCLF